MEMSSSQCFESRVVMKALISRITLSPGLTVLTFDPEGRLTIDQHGNHRVVRLESDGQVTLGGSKIQRQTVK